MKRDKAGAFRLGWSPALGHDLGISGYYGRYTPDFLPSAPLWAFGLDGKTTLGPFEIEGQYVFTRFEGIRRVAQGFARAVAERGVSTELTPLNTTVEFELAGLATTKHGYWLDLRYRFFPDFLRDIGLLGTATAGGLHWSAAVTEDPRVDSTEVWELLNTTGDAHPIHVHLVRFQVLNRQPFDLSLFQATGEIKLLGPPKPPAPNERGAWKDTVKVFPGDPDDGVGSLTRIIQKFELPRGVSIPPGQVLPYVWHCHILEHEDNGMMRPYNVVT